jgi:hypothetical protein
MNGDAKKSAKSSPNITIHHYLSPNITMRSRLSDSIERQPHPRSAVNPRGALLVSCVWCISWAPLPFAIGGSISPRYIDASSTSPRAFRVSGFFRISGTRLSEFILFVPCSHLAVSLVPRSDFRVPRSIGPRGALRFACFERSTQPFFCQRMNRVWQVRRWSILPSGAT